MDEPTGHRTTLFFLFDLVLSSTFNDFSSRWQVRRCIPAEQLHVELRVAFLPEISASTNVKYPMKNAKWWYSIGFKIDFILAVNTQE
jgi:Na+-transporting NADH:ubiquinone oxidoreductase subunit NqrB